MIREGTSDMDDTSPAQSTPPANIRFLSRLVTVLAVTMIVGVLAIVSLIVIRFSDRAPVLPDTITLPDGTQATAFTQGESWYAVVTADDRILIYDRFTGALRQTVEVLH